MYIYIFSLYLSLNLSCICVPFIGILDVDQYFSVISRRFKQLVFRPGQRFVVSPHDFAVEVNASFTRPENRPLCVERVAANHDFAAWLLPFRDERMTYITDFRHFRFTNQNQQQQEEWTTGLGPRTGVVGEGLDEVEEVTRVRQFAVHNDKATMRSKEYMSSHDTEYQPGVDDLRAFGPNVVLRHGPVGGTPTLEPYRDLTIPVKDKDGKDKPVPRDHVGKTHTQILEVEKEKWRAWVQAPRHGALDVQKDQFEELLETMVAHPDDLPANIPPEFVQRRFQLPLPFRIRQALPMEEPANQLDIAEPPRPPPRIGYGELGNYRAGAAKRAHRRVLKARKEALEGMGNFAAIARGDILLLQVRHEGSAQLEWYLGISMDDYAEAERNVDGEEEVEVQWMYPSEPRSRKRAAINDLNGVFLPWFIEGKGKRGAKNTEMVARDAVQLVGVQLHANKAMNVKTKRAIADLVPGFEYIPGTRTLNYKNAPVAM